jgi:hypothetical protein
MNYQGQLGLLRSLNMDPETVTLPSHVGHRALAKAVIVEASFPNSQDFGQCGTREQIIQRGFLRIFLIGVNTHRAPKIRMARGQGVNRWKALKTRADDQRTIHP